MQLFRRQAFLLPALFAIACSGETGPAGPVGPGGDPGSIGDPGGDGQAGTDGQNGNDGRNPLLVGPGLQVEIMDAQIDSSSVATVVYRITDDNGRPLDLDGLFTEGAVSPRFILASLDESAASEPLQYTAYTDNSIGQAATDSGGTNMEIGVGDGVYEYTFGTAATGFDASKTHTVGIQARRDFEDERYVANATFDFVPDGSNVTNTRDIVTTSACNGCHNPLALHGGSRREIKLCILCHQPQTTDPESGNTVDFKVMIHKIHRGAELPSVEAGGDYEIIGHNNNVHSYNTVEFPQDIRSCDTCHTGTDGDLWMTRPTRATCRSCHDLTSFEQNVPAGEDPHPAGPMPDDTACTNIGCHQPTGGLAGIVDKHLFQLIDPATPQFSIAIDDVRNSAPGQVPQVDITVLVDNAGRDILTSPLNRLRFTVAGPTTDYEDYFQVTAQNNGANADGTITAIDAAAGKFTYTFPATDPIPATATGSYAVGIEARIPSATGNVNVFNPVRYFAVTDATPVPRRDVVDQAGCDSCHLSLGLHGGSRRNHEYCVLCHNPNNTNDERVSAIEGTVQFVNTVDFKVMIHGIHRGEDHENDYTLGGFPTPTESNPAGNPIDFTELRFPGDLRSCGTCHVAGSFELPLGDNVLPSRFETLTCIENPGTDADDLCESRTSAELFVPPTTAVCTACHDSDSTVAHAEIMTTSSGVESCATCHGPDSAFDIAIYHQLDP